MQQETTSFFNKIESVYNSKLPFVVYRKPNEKLISLQVQNTVELFELKSFQEAGYVFAPFDSNGQKIIFPLNESEQFSITVEDFSEIKISSRTTEIENVTNLNFSKKHHISLVEKVIDKIQNKEAEKIVVSRKESFKTSNFDVLNSYKKMLQNYPNAMVYLWFHPKVGCWMGASPERLIHCSNRKFKTMALAGTQSYNDTTDVVWKEKEKEEQQFVTDYILKTISGTITNVTFTNPYTVKAGNLLHLRTDIYGDLEREDGIDNLIKLLHPTPAVCGLPKKTATDFIIENEAYQRSFYSGYLGELKIKSETNLYVNLRCMKINSDEVSIYVGGGITVNSNPEKEWEETVFKAAVMKKVL